MASSLLADETGHLQPNGCFVRLVLMELAESVAVAAQVP